MKQQGYREIFKQRAYVQMLGANFINRFGDAIDMIAFSWLVYALTQSASWSAIVLGVNMLPNVLIQPFAGAWIERMNKKRVMVLCDLFRGLMTIGIAICYLNGWLSPWFLLVITFLNNTFESFRNPASVAFFPKLLPSSLYETGISLNQTSSRLCELIGVALAGVLLSTIGIGSAILMDALTFFISAVMIAMIRVGDTASSQIETTATAKGFWVLLKEGFRYVFQMPVLLYICLMAAMMNMVLVPYNSFQAPYISGVLHQDATLLSASSTLLSIGIMMGSAAYPLLHRRITHRVLILCGVMGTALFYFGAYLLCFLTSTLGIYVGLSALSLIFGFAIAQLLNISSVALMQNVTEDYLARVSAIFNAVGTASMPLSSFMISAICVSVSVQDMYLWFGLFTFLLFVGMIFMKTLKKL